MLTREDVIEANEEAKERLQAAEEREVARQIAAGLRNDEEWAR